MIDATAVILTKNERSNIGDCLASLQGFAKRCVVVDSGSTDDTEKIARSFGADFYFHEFEYYARQFNWGIDNCGIDTDWIIRIDADERFTDELKKEIEDILNGLTDQTVTGIALEADYYFLGRHIKHGMRKKRRVMIFKRGIGRVEDRKRDAGTVLGEGKAISAKHRFVHYDFKDLDSYIRKYNWYATREAIDYIEYLNGANAYVNTDKKVEKQRKKKFGFYYKFPKFLRAHLWYIYNYYFKLGFLDGKEGKIFFYLECYWYRYLVDAKIYEYQKFGKAFDELKALD